MRVTPAVLTLATLSLLTGAACAPPPPAAPPVAVAPPPPPPVADGIPDEPLPFDARIRTGKLPNGLTYYVLAHRKPEHRAQVWLAVNAGSVLEDDDQRGLAHFVEHMGFNGTKRFPKQALVDMLEKSGVSFGADLNAHTSFDETVYTLQVPTDSGGLLDRAISVLRDWSDGVTFDPLEVEKERGVVLEEWRLGRGAGTRLLDKQAPVFFHGSKYADRIIIGKPEIIKNASRDTLARFYKDWYRPDLMAVIAVGDFDADATVAKIKAEFASLPAATSPRPRPAVPMPPHDKELFTIESDPEATSTSIVLLSEMPHRPIATTRDERRTFTEALFSQMLNARLDEIRRQPSAPFLFAASHTSALVRPDDVFTLAAVVKDGGVQAGWAAILAELARVERHGFLQTELDRAKVDLLRYMERAVTQYETNDSREFADEIVRNFLTGEAIPGPAAELASAQRLLPTCTLADVNGLAKSLPQGSRVIAVTGPATMTKPTEDELRGTMTRVAASHLEPYDDRASNTPLMATLPTPGSVVATSAVPELGVTVWTLSNGIRVIVKPTDFKADEVRLVGFAEGGTSLASDADFDSARFASTVVAQGGVGPFDATALRKALSGKVAGASASIGELEENLAGSAAPSDLETMFQLVNLEVTAPRRDEGAFAAWITSETERAKNRRLSPETSFHEDFTTFFAKNHRRRQPVTPEVVQRVDLDKALAFYKARFADASGFTFVIVGNVDLERTKHLVETYLASLPGTGPKGKHESWRDIHLEHPSGVVKKSVAQGSEPKSQVSIDFHGSETWTRETDNDLRMLAEVLRIRLREILREDMGGVYHVGVTSTFARRPKQRYVFNVSFGCAPENVAKLEKAVMDEIASLQKSDVGADYIAKVKEIRRRTHETSLRENSYWMGELERAYRYGDDPKLILDFDAMVDHVTGARVRAAAKKYLPRTEYAVGELMPATTTSP